MRLLAACLLGCAAIATQALAAPERYRIDPDHTYPSFEFAHMGIQAFEREQAPGMPGVGGGKNLNVRVCVPADTSICMVVSFTQVMCNRVGCRITPPAP